MKKENEKIAQTTAPFVATENLPTVAGNLKRKGVFVSKVRLSARPTRSLSRSRSMKPLIIGSTTEKK